MQIQILTLFPELFDQFSKSGLLSRAISDGHVSLNAIQLRDFAINAHGQVDDTPYGGGSGMVLRPEPAAAAIEQAKARDPQATVVLMTPRGKVFNQQAARALAARCAAGEGGLIFLTPRYEGVDERICEELVDLELGIGDYILLGGEIAAMAVIEAVTRLLPGVLGNPESTVHESFESGLLEYPQYTKPQMFRECEVPGVLLSGNHGEIARWRAEQALRDTAERRPDLVRALPPAEEVCIALIHYPVTDKHGDIVTSSITNIDLHDIARTAKTYGISRFYAAHPVKTLRRLALKIEEHWATGYGASYNPNRREALAVLATVPDLEDCIIDIEARTGKLPRIVTTSARPSSKSISFAQLRVEMSLSDRPHLILLGTGWGLAPEILARADLHLEPICGPTEYNHLSVRSAAAIICDRLFGRADH